MKYFTEMAAIITLTSNLVSGIDIPKEAPSKQIIETLNLNYEEDKQSLIAYKLQQFKMEQDKIKEQVEIERQEAIKAQIALEQQQNEFKSFVKVVKSHDTTKIDLRKPSGLTPELANEVLKGTGLEGLGEAFVNSEKRHGVNAYYLMAHAAWESQWGKSNLSKTKNNLFGFQAYDNDPYNKARRFNSKGESIDVVANYVSKHYLQADGDHYNGPTLSGMNIKYASDNSWAQGIGSIMDKFVFELAKLKGV